MTEVFRIATLRGKRNTSTELTCKTLKSEISCVELNLERNIKTYLVFFFVVIRVRGYRSFPRAFGNVLSRVL